MRPAKDRRQLGRVSSIAASVKAKFLCLVTATKKNDRAVLDADAKGNLKAFKKQIDAATKFIPLWVKLSSPLAAGKRLHCVP